MKHIFCSLALLICSLVVLSVRAQQSRIDSLETLLARTPADTNRVLLLSTLANQYKNWGNDPDKIKEYAQQSMQLAYQLNYPAGKGKAHYAMAGYYYNRNEYQEALEHNQKAIDYFREAGRKKDMASTYNTLAIIMEDMGNYTLAMEYYLNCTRVAEQIGDTALIGYNLSHMGIFMQNQKKYPEALTYLFQALPIHEQGRDGRMKAFTLNAIGLVYLELRQYDDAHQYLYECLHICDSLQLPWVRVNNYNNVGLLHFYRQEYAQALDYLQRVLELARQLGANQSLSIALRLIGDVYQKTGKIPEAIAYYQQALQVAEAHQLIQDKLLAHEGLVQTYDRLQNYPQAYWHQSRLLALKDSVYNQENDRKIAQLEASYAMEKKQTELALLQKDRQQQIWARNTIVAGLLISLALTGLVVNRQRLKIRQGRLLVQKSEEIAVKNRQLEQQSARLAQQTNQLQELDRAKSRFFTNISHEFRTPLTLILTPLEKLLTGQTAPGQLPHYYQLIDRNARHLLQLINELLDFSKLEAGSLTINRIRADVNKHLRRTTLSFSSLAESKQIQLQFISGYETIETLFDPDILDKILNNLLSNAFKFTPPEGTVTVLVSLAEAAAGPEPNPAGSWQLTIQVSDTGIGIPASQQERIFDRFYQIDSSQTREQEGTGIGLALVKELVELQQGTVAVTSEPGRGTQFTVHLPLSECYPVAAGPGETVTVQTYVAVEENTSPFPDDQGPVPSDGRLPLMLIVEDNDEMREFIRDSFRNEFRLVEAADGATGVSLARKEIPDIIITDLMMPKIDGVELCQRIKTDERTSHIPVIMLTAKANPESKIEGLETGADDYIVKPFSVQELSVRVKNLIAQRQKLRERFTREVKLQPADIAITSADEVFLTKAIGLIEQYMSDTDFSVEKLVHEIGMSRVQLHRKLKALTNQSTSEFIRTIRLKRAAALLEQQYGNIAEVMYEVGFTNVSYFASSFKKLFGLNPSDYSQQARGQIQKSREPVP